MDTNLPLVVDASALAPVGGAGALDLSVPLPQSDDDRLAAQQSAERATKRDAFLQLAKKRWQLVNDTESQLRARMLEDLEFLQPGQQWPLDLKNDRKADGRPCLEVDRLTGPIKQVCNQQRQLRPSIVVNPVDSGADPKTAEVLQGMTRHVEIQSDADVAYDTAGEHQVKCGRGWLRVLTEYAPGDTFEQVIRIRRVRNPFSIYLDPTGTMADGSDARFGFVVEDIPEDEYRARFPEKDGVRGAPPSLTEFEGKGNALISDWFPEGRIRIAEYFYRDDLDEALVQIPGEAKPRRVPAASLPDPLPQGWKARPITTPKVKWALINARDILEGDQGANAEQNTEGRECPGKYIPLVPVTGDESDINGVVDYRGIVRTAKDTQRMANFWKSAATETIALAPRAPFIGAAGQFENHPEWKLANRRNYAYLEYNPIDLGGQRVPPPQRQFAEPPIQAITAAMMQNEQDLRAVTGYVDVQAHETRQETSGRAILARQKQAEIGNSNYIDNLARAIRQVGRIVIDLIPKIYDVPRVVRILGLDEQPKAVMVHALTNPQPGDVPAPDALPDGVQGIYDLSVGTYDVTVTVGPSHQSQRQEAVDAMLQLVQSVPAIGPAAADLLVGQMDWPGARQISERLKKLLPPQLQDQPPGSAPAIPPELQQQLMQARDQAQAMIDALTQQVNELQREKDGKLVDAQIRQQQIESQERIAALKVQADLAKTEATLNAQNAQLMVSEQMAAIQHHLDHLDSLYAMTHAADEAALDRQHAADQAAQDRELAARTPAAPSAGATSAP